MKRTIAATLALVLVLALSAGAGELDYKELVCTTAIVPVSATTQTWKNVWAEVQQVTLYAAGGATGTCAVALNGPIPAVTAITLASYSAITNGTVAHYWPLASGTFTSDAGVTNGVPYVAVAQDITFIVTEYDTNRVNTFHAWIKVRDSR